MNTANQDTLPPFKVFPRAPQVGDSMIVLHRSPRQYYDEEQMARSAATVTGVEKTSDKFLVDLFVMPRGMIAKNLFNVPVRLYEEDAMHRFEQGQEKYQPQAFFK